MTAPIRVTRSSLVRLARRREQVDKGAALLKKKRDALVVQLFARVRPTVDARHRIDRLAAQAYAALVDALAAAGVAEVESLGWPTRELRATDPPPKLVRDAPARGWAPGQVDGAMQPAAQAFERLVELVLATAPEESAIRRLSRELAHTVRQVNVLEQRVAVDLVRSLVRVRRTLDEREREEALRLRRVAARARAAR